MDADAFSLNLFRKTASARKPDIDLGRLLRILPEDDAELAQESLLQALLELAAFSESERELLRLGSLLPPDGVGETLFEALLPENERETAQGLESIGWLTREKNGWSQNYRLRRLIADQEWFPRQENCGGIVRRCLALTAGTGTALDRVQLQRLDALVRRLLTLDGLPEGERRELCLQTASLLRASNPRAADKLAAKAQHGTQK